VDQIVELQSTLTMKNVSITETQQSKERGIAGGALFLDGGNSNILKCIFSNNSASLGGAIFFRGNVPGEINHLTASLVVDNCTFSNNMAHYALGSW
jgi:predicted outer membrane repeat protein